MVTPASAAAASIISFVIFTAPFACACAQSTPGNKVEAKPKPPHVAIKRRRSIIRLPPRKTTSGRHYTILSAATSCRKAAKSKRATKNEEPLPSAKGKRLSHREAKSMSSDLPSRRASAGLALAFAFPRNLCLHLLGFLQMRLQGGQRLLRILFQRIALCRRSCALIFVDVLLMILDHIARVCLVECRP